MHCRYELFRADTQGEVMQQFASIVGAPLTWEFELKSASDQTLALIDRNFSVRKPLSAIVLHAVQGSCLARFYCSEPAARLPLGSTAISNAMSLQFEL